MDRLGLTLNGEPVEVGEGGLVDAEGHGISWQEYLHGDVESLPEERPVPLVVVCAENGYGCRETGIYLVGEDTLIQYENYDDIWNVDVETGATDPIAAALDAAAADIRAVAVSVLGPLLDDAPDLAVPEFQHSPWSDDMGGDASEDPGLYWTSSILVDPRVERLFRERLTAGAYPKIAKMRQGGGAAWKKWVRSLLTAVPLEALDCGVAKDGYPRYTEADVLRMSAEELVQAARQVFRRPGA
jgi:hypothetical protein